jgi:predicted SPOUT superfamily RNA methylase MTH1
VGKKAKYLQGFGREIKGKRPLVNLGIAARIILKWIVKIHRRRTWTSFI